MLNKPNQHYVWQKYLEPWAKNDKIVCLRNNKNIIKTNLRNIASERYFYKINNLTYNDCQLIRKIFINNRPEFMKYLLDGWVKPVETVLMLYNQNVKSKGIRGSIENDKELGLKNILEDLHMHIEGDAISALSKVQLGDVSFFTDSNDENEMDVDFILYLSFQYFRTKKIKQSVKESLGEHISLFTDFDDAFNLIAPIISTVFGYSIYNRIKNKEFYCYAIKNTTETAFITGDQPVINTKANFSGETSELELYYPLSPSIALLVTKEKNLNIECSIEKIKEYNDMIERQSLALIFANDESDLQKYIVG